MLPDAFPTTNGVVPSWRTRPMFCGRICMTKNSLPRGNSMMQSNLLVGRDSLVSSHAGTRLPIAVFSSQGAPPPTGSSELCLPPFAWILKCSRHCESLDDLLHDAAQMAAFRFDIACCKDAGHHGDAGDIRSSEIEHVVPVDAADGHDRDCHRMANG